MASWRDFVTENPQIWPWISEQKCDLNVSWARACLAISVAICLRQLVQVVSTTCTCNTQNYHVLFLFCYAFLSNCVVDSESRICIVNRGDVVSFELRSEYRTALITFVTILNCRLLSLREQELRCYLRHWTHHWQAAVGFRTSTWRECFL